jgi:hypothetical protein
VTRLSECAVCLNSEEIAVLCGDALVPMVGPDNVTHVCSNCLADPDIQPWRAVVDASAGCCNHIVTDDGNCGNDSLAYCREQAERAGHTFCLEVNRRFAAMTYSERRAVIGYGGGAP